MHDGAGLAAPALDTDAAQLLASWFSPAYPVGGFSYSHGLEWAIATGEVADAAALEDWVQALLAHGAGRTEAILLLHAHGAQGPADLAEVATVAEALAASAERHLETMAQGAAFARITAAVHGLDLPPLPYPVAAGRAARLMGLPAVATATFYLQAFATHMVSAGVRLIPLGQTAGQAIVVRLMPLAAGIARDAQGAPIEAAGGFAFRGDLAAMHHETQRTRLFRS